MQFTITNTSPSPSADTARADMVVTTEMTQAGAAIPANLVVSQAELLPGEVHHVEIQPGQYLTVTPFRG